MKKLIPVIIGVLMLTGCSSRKNVNEKAYLRAASADGRKMTFVFYSTEDIPLTVTADDPEKAISEAELSLGREIFTGHTELILLRNCDKQAVLEYVLRKWKVSPTCMVAETETPCEEILNNKTPGQITGEIKVAQEKGIAEKCDIITVLGELLRSGE